MEEKTMAFPIEGTCQCGQVKYKLYDKPKAVFACHCTECQKLSTSPFSVTALIETSQIAFSGEMRDWVRTADSGNQNLGKFCPVCGNRIYHFNPADLTTVKLKLKPTGLQDDSLFQPTAHVWVSEKVDWFIIPDNVKQFKKQPG